MIKSVQFMSVQKAEALIPDRPTVAVSILSPGMEEARLQGFRDILRLFFTDAVTAENEGPVLFDAHFAQQIVDFLTTYHAMAEDYDLVIHCQAGVSRSAAVAVWAASEFNVPLSGYFAMLNPLVLHHLVRCKSPQYEHDHLFE